MRIFNQNSKQNITLHYYRFALDEEERKKEKKKKKHIPILNFSLFVYIFIPSYSLYWKMKWIKKYNKKYLPSPSNCSRELSRKIVEWHTHVEKGRHWTRKHNDEGRGSLKDVLNWKEKCTQRGSDHAKYIGEIPVARWLLETGIRSESEFVLQVTGANFCGRNI